MKKEDLGKVIEEVLGYDVNSFVFNVKANGDIEKLRVNHNKLTTTELDKLVSNYPELFGANGEKFKDSK
tara:strand:+ start:507 stop:713 length:207 start_codon:yes stop_codon:yes gene_type:complete